MRSFYLVELELTFKSVYRSILTVTAKVTTLLKRFSLNLLGMIYGTEGRNRTGTSEETGF